MPRIPKSVAPYYNRQKEPQRSLMIEMRDRVLEVIPDADEVIKYMMPTFVVDGIPIVGLMAHKNHVGFYPYSGAVISQFPEIESKYATTPGSVHIPLTGPLTKAEVKKLIKARLKINKMRG